MDKSQCKAIVDANLKQMVWQLQIQNWRLEIDYRSLGCEGAKGQCTINTPYDRAYIELDPEAFETESEVLDTLRHELLHVVMAPFDLYHTTVFETLEGESSRKVANHMFTHVAEQLVVKLERLLDHGHKPCPDWENWPPAWPAAPQPVLEVVDA